MTQKSNTISASMPDNFFCDTDGQRKYTIIVHRHCKRPNKTSTQFESSSAKCQVGIRLIGERLPPCNGCLEYPHTAVDHWIPSVKIPQVTVAIKNKLIKLARKSSVSNIRYQLISQKKSKGDISYKHNYSQDLLNNPNLRNFFALIYICITLILLHTFQLI